VRTARLAVVLDDIAARIHDPSLTVASFARAQGISPRYLQRILEQGGVRFTEHLNELRLMRAYELLADPRRASRRISDIALEAGFSDVSHFNRLFRARFGDTPSAVRAKRANRGR
jgi:AraC-like DNA-binding protein